MCFSPFWFGVAGSEVLPASIRFLVLLVLHFSSATNSRPGRVLGAPSVQPEVFVICFILVEFASVSTSARSLVFGAASLALSGQALHQLRPPPPRSSFSAEIFVALLARGSRLCLHLIFFMLGAQL
jgi:hypothetical protein